MAQLIGISGKAGHGKDTLAFMLMKEAKKQGVVASRRALADALKEEAAEMLSTYSRHEVSSFLKDKGCAWQKRIAICLQLYENPPALERFLAFWRLDYRADKDRNFKGRYKMCLAEMHHPRKKSRYRMFLQWYGTEYRRQQCSGSYWTDKLLAIAATCSDDILFVPDCRFINEVCAIQKFGGKLIRVTRPGRPSTGEHVSETSLDNYTPFDYHLLNTTKKALRKKALEILPSLLSP